MDESEQQAAFEAWFLADVNGSGADLDQDDNDGYESYATQLAFEAWMASARKSYLYRCNICGGVVQFDGTPPVRGMWGGRD